jgi:polygalacturonase
VPDGHTLNTRQIQAAIEDASKQGGGVVYVPPGTFVTGGLTLRSHITLYLEAGSVLSGSGNTVDYEFHPGPPTDGDTNGRHLIFARDCVDIEISVQAPLTETVRPFGSTGTVSSRLRKICGAMSFLRTGCRAQHRGHLRCWSSHIAATSG